MERRGGFVDRDLFSLIRVHPRRSPRHPRALFTLTRLARSAITPPPRRSAAVKRFEFSLDRLLRVKRQLERVAELEQRRAQDATEQARAKLDALRDQLAQ